MPPTRRNSKLKTDPSTAAGLESDAEAPLPPFLTLSVRTSLAILHLLDESQLDYELKYIKLYNPKFSHNATTEQEKRDTLKSVLDKTLAIEYDNVLDSYDTLIKSVATATEQTNKLVKTVEDATNSITAQITTLPTPSPNTPAALLHPHVTTDPAETTFSGNLENPVSLCECSFSDITVQDLTRLVKFDSTHPGGRCTSYFGNQPYRYGRVCHEPAPYPTSPIFDKIFDTLASYNPEITRETYTCLATLYNDGGVAIPLHSDNESTISPESMIYCVSLGATRVLKVSNTDGPLTEHEIPLENGSMYCMTRASQDMWRHGIDRDSSITTPRVSLTFRKLCNPAPIVRSTIPPVAPPKTRQTPPSQPRTSRVLFLHDSIHSTCPEKIFESVPGHTCVKKTNYQLTNIFGFEPEFKHARSVIISCGVNDLARYGKTAHSLADLTCNRLAKCCRDNPNTNFIFNSITLTKNNGWLNKEIDQFNMIMYDLSRNVPNLVFFDSHALILNMVENEPSAPVWSRIDSNGIKFDLGVLKMVTRELVNTIGYLSGSHDPRFRSCRWLYNTAKFSSSHRSG